MIKNRRETEHSAENDLRDAILLGDGVWLTVGEERGQLAMLAEKDYRPMKAGDLVFFEGRGVRLEEPVASMGSARARIGIWRVTALGV